MTCKRERKNMLLSSIKHLRGPVHRDVFVLMGWPLQPNALWPFQISYAPPNLGITRTWICWLNFSQRFIFSGLRFFNESEISDSGRPAWSPSRRTCAQDFYVLKKSINLSQPMNLGSREHVTRDHRGRHIEMLKSCSWNWC